MTETLAARAGRFAWQSNLRGYDAVQLTSAVAWQDMTVDTEDEIGFACNELARAARAEGLETWPE